MRRLTWSWSLLVIAVASTAYAHEAAAAPATTGSGAQAAVVSPAAAASARASTAPASVPAPTPPPAALAPAPAAVGVAVVALPGATDAAWPLARAIYATPSLRPAALDEAHARVLCGEPASAAAPADLRDLADTVAAVHGDDAPSRAMLGNIAHRFAVKALVLVRVDAGHASARAFLPDLGAFDAAAYSPDEGAPPGAPGGSAPIAWSAATRSLARTYGAAEPAAASPLPSPAPMSAPAHGAVGLPTPTAAPALATHAEPHIDNGPPTSRPFWQSGWFWGAVGAAAFAGGALYFATRDNGPTTIHLQAQVPH